MNLIAFLSDNCSVMKGRPNSVLSQIRNVQPEVLDVGCICHLAKISVACALSIDCQLIDVYFHFNHSSKRKEEYQEFLEFCDVATLKILKHASTQWLSLEKCINCFLLQQPALLSYFESHEDREWPGCVK